MGSAQPSLRPALVPAYLWDEGRAIHALYHLRYEPGRLTVQDSERERVSSKLHRDKNLCGFGCDVRQRHDELTQRTTTIVR